MRYVITGGLGFIGCNFIKLLQSTRQDVEIINIDKVTYAADIELNSVFAQKNNYQFIQADICDFSFEEHINKNDIVVNFAAESHVDRSISDPQIFVKTNVIGVANLLEIARRKEVAKFVQISTDEVYGSLDFNQTPSTEEDILNPSSPYSASKAAAEMLCMGAAKTYKQNIVITRSSNNYGPNQYAEKIIPLFIKRLLNKQKVPVYGNGSNIRDWLHVSDNCRGILTVIEHGKNNEIYNIGGGNQVSNLDLTKQIISILGMDENFIEYVTDRAGHDLRYDIDCTKLKKLGWTPDIHFKNGLLETVEWYKKMLNDKNKIAIATMYTPDYGDDARVSSSFGHILNHAISQSSVKINHRNDLGKLLNHLGYTGIGAEVGVLKGEYAKIIREEWKGLLYLIDCWEHQDDGYIDAANHDNNQHMQNLAEVQSVFAGDANIRIVQGYSPNVSSQFADAFFDWVYIDANHSYEAVLADLRAWYPKIRKGGMFCGHDFLDGQLPCGNFGVQSAVTKFCAEIKVNLMTTNEHHPSWYFIKTK